MAMLRSCLLAFLACHGVLAHAGDTVYRCPGPPVLYTDAMSPQEARDKGCRTIEGTPITIIQGPRRPAAAAQGASGPAAQAPRPADSRVDPAAQRQRDGEARRILTGHRTFRD